MPTAAYRESLGLPADPASDAIWQQRIAAGTATEAQARAAISAKEGNWSSGEAYDAGSGGMQFAPSTWESQSAIQEREQERQRQVDFRNAAPQWLSGPLLDDYVSTWSRTGDPNLALAAVRRSSSYDAMFPGNRRDDGTLRHGENEYFATRDAFRNTMVEFGVGNVNDSDIVELFEGDVSANEFFRAVETGFSTFTEPGSTQPPAGLLGQFVSSFIGGSSLPEALSAARQSSEYDSIFQGNRREDGSLRMAEQDYYAYTRDWDRVMASYGLNPEMMNSHSERVRTIEAEMSINELESRIRGVADGIESNIGQVQQAYAQFYGLEMSREAILASAIDPEIASDIFERRISAAQVGGEAALQGFARNVQRAENLSAAGLTQQAARQLYSDAARQLPGLDAAAERFRDPRGGFGVESFEDAGVFGDSRVQQRMNRRMDQEMAGFSPRGTVAMDDRGLAGLRQR